jgi:hypothetical protein
MTTVVKSIENKVKTGFVISEKFDKALERGSVVLDKINTEASIYSIHLKNKNFNHFVYSLKSTLPMPINSHIIEIENGIVKLFICNEYETRDITVDFIAF